MKTEELRAHWDQKYQQEMFFLTMAASTCVKASVRRSISADLWLAKIESGLRLGGNFSDTNHVCSVC